MDGVKCFLVSGSINEILIEVFHVEEHSLGFIVDRCSEKQKGLSDI